MKELCSNLASRSYSSGKNYYWSCSSRINCVSISMLKEMASAGCQAIFFGIESGSDRIQKSIKKNLDLEGAYEKVSHAVKLGINITVSYMCGFPDETVEDFEMTLWSILRMSVLGAYPQLSTLSILPGTPIFEENWQKLEFDTEVSGFSDTAVTEPVNDLIKSDKRMFSSFYYYPNPHLKRENLIFFTRIVNHLRYFLPTLIGIADNISRDTGQKSLYSLFTDRIRHYPETGNAQNTELVFLIDCIKEYLEYRSSKGLPEYIWDLFTADLTKAFMHAKYIIWQLKNINHGSGRYGQNRLSGDDAFRIIPAWKMITADYNILHLANNETLKQKKLQKREGFYNYVVCPASDRDSMLIRVSGRSKSILQNLKQGKVSEFVDLSRNYYTEKESYDLLRRMIRAKMIEIVT